MDNYRVNKLVIMGGTTEQEILDAALEEFAKEGYVGARTRIIAEKSGFSEMTLFRKFKTKENLFKSVLIQNKQIFIEELESILAENSVEDPRGFLKHLIEHISNLIEHNLKFIMISFHEGYRVPEMKGINNLLISKIAERIESQNMSVNDGIDYRIMAFNIITFLFFINIDKPIKSVFSDHKNVIEEFIDYQVKVIQS